MLSKKTNLFLDTNVVIGYIFCLDSVYVHSKDIFDSNNNFYYSYHVKKEIDDVYKRKDDECSKFFMLLQSKLRRFKSTDFVSLSDFHLFIDESRPINKMNIKDMHYALDFLWKLFDFGENQEVGEIKVRLRDFNVLFDKRHSNKQIEFNNLAYYVSAHKQKDVEVSKLIKKNLLYQKLHGEDENILFDLHEFNKNNSISNMILVSWDRDFIEVVEKLIIKLSFDKYICLNDMENNQWKKIINNT